METVIQNTPFTDFDHITVDSPLKSLPLYSGQVSPTILGKDISAMFRDNPLLPGVIINQKNKIIGLLSRDIFHETLSKRFGREIFSGRPISVLLDLYESDYLSFPSNHPIKEAAQTAFARDEKHINQPILVTFKDGEAKLLSSFDLLKAQCQLIVLSERQLNEHQNKIIQQRLLEEQVRQQNELLEQRIFERTKELDNIQKDLVEASHRAGMAEVATDVLHNVGNVLNSVNVTANIITEQINALEINNIQKITEMLKTNHGRLDDFLSNDEKGMHILPYLEELALDMNQQQASLSNKLVDLNRYVDHIKEIVKTQQNYAKSSQFETETELKDILDDAININSAALDRHKVMLEVNIDDIPPVMIDRQKVLQILVNLISNAKYAVSEYSKSEKLITINLKKMNDNFACFLVIDNGIGISEDNINKIFQHGFTTKKHGHGFGLHSSFLSANAIGGDLRASSKGKNQGAVFTLTLPLHPVETNSERK